MLSDAVLILAATKALQNALESAVTACGRASVVSNLEGTKLLLDAASRTSEVSSVLIEVSLSCKDRSNFSGVKVGQLLRRQYDFQGALIFVGFPSPQVMSADFSLLRSEVPGSKYLCAPFSATELCEALKSTTSITTEQLDRVVVAHCGIREEVRLLIHDLSSGLYLALESDNKTTADLNAKSLGSYASNVAQLSALLNRYGSAELSALLAEMNGLVADRETLTNGDITRLLVLLDQIDASMKSDTTTNKNEAYPAVAPEGYETLFIADDDGFSEAGVQYLEACGYSIVVERSAEAVKTTLSADPGAVFLCDQTFGVDSSAGRRLMALARLEQWKLIIALSGARLDAAEVPEADAICAGPLAKLDTGARRVHEIICEWAITHP